MYYDLVWYQCDHVWDWALLKAFDRAFWVRNLKEPSNCVYQPEVQNDKCACPFGDPHQAI